MVEASQCRMHLVSSAGNDTVSLYVRALSGLGCDGANKEQNPQRLSQISGHLPQGALIKSLAV